MTKCGIYKIINVVNGKMYVGSSKDLDHRLYSHRCYLNNNKNLPNRHLQNAWNKYGENSFIFEIIEIILIKDKEYIKQREQYWVDILNSEYNKRKRVESNIGFRFSEEVKKKLSEIKMGEKNTFYGKHHTEETKQKQREKMIGRNLSNEHKQKISESLRGENNPNFGKSLSQETKRKLSEARKGEKNLNYGKYGESASFFKLTWKQVREIREKYIPWKYTYKLLAKEYNVGKTAIREIIFNETWKE